MAEFLTINNDINRADKKDIDAQKQWELQGTVSADYLKHVLGDISQCVSVYRSEAKQEHQNRKAHNKNV